MQASSLISPNVSLAPGGEEPGWQEQLRRAYTRLDELVADQILAPGEAHALTQDVSRFRFRLPRYYARLIDPKKREACPIWRQAIPNELERDPVLPAWARTESKRLWGRETPWLDDAIGDCAHLAAPRLTHRYRARALLHITDICGLYCRFCFRKGHLAERETSLYRGAFAPALAYLETHTEVREIILTGGDPLSMTDTYLERLVEQLASIKHLEVIRIHSRMPVTLPARLTPELAASLTRNTREKRPRVVLVTHFNHPRELTREARRGLEALQNQGVTVYNQAVLMRRINDSVSTLTLLCQRLYTWGVTPLYLHHPDLTPGTFGFRLGIARGRRLARVLRGTLSGPAVPTYVLDLPGGLGKVSLLDSRARILRRFDSPEVRGTLWSFSTSTTRAGGGEVCEYLDLRAKD